MDDGKGGNLYEISGSKERKSEQVITSGVVGNAGTGAEARVCPYARSLSELGSPGPGSRLGLAPLGLEALHPVWAL